MVTPSEPSAENRELSLPPVSSREWFYTWLSVGCSRVSVGVWTLLCNINMVVLTKNGDGQISESWPASEAYTELSTAINNLLWILEDKTTAEVTSDSPLLISVLQDFSEVTPLKMIRLTNVKRSIRSEQNAGNLLHRDFGFPSIKVPLYTRPSAYSINPFLLVTPLATPSNMSPFVYHTRSSFSCSLVSPVSHRT